MDSWGSVYLYFKFAFFLLRLDNLYCFIFKFNIFSSGFSILIFSPFMELLNFSYFVLGLKFYLLLLYSGLKFPFCFFYIFYFFRKTFYSFAVTVCFSPPPPTCFKCILTCSSKHFYGGCFKHFFMWCLLLCQHCVGIYWCFLLNSQYFSFLVWCVVFY